MANRDPKSPSVPPATTAKSSSADVAAFLADVRGRTAARADDGRGRLIFALDATMSRQPTWDLAIQIQADMFREAGAVGGLDIQLVYYRGIGECRASPWLSDAAALERLMSRIDCRGGQTQIGRILQHAGNESERGKVDALCFVGDAMEESLDALCAAAAPLAMRGVPAFLFQEGEDAVAEQAFREIARLTRGAYCRFGAGSAAELRALLRAVAAYASGGRRQLKALAGQAGGEAARLLLEKLG